MSKVKAANPAAEFRFKPGKPQPDLAERIYRRLFEYSTYDGHVTTKNFGVPVQPRTQRERILAAIREELSR